MNLRPFPFNSLGNLWMQGQMHGAFARSVFDFRRCGMIFRNGKFQVDFEAIHPARRRGPHHLFNLTRHAVQLCAQTVRHHGHRCHDAGHQSCRNQISWRKSRALPAHIRWRIREHFRA